MLEQFGIGGVLFMAVKAVVRLRRHGADGGAECGVEFALIQLVSNGGSCQGSFVPCGGGRLLAGMILQDVAFPLGAAFIHLEILIALSIRNLPCDSSNH